MKILNDSNGDIDGTVQLSCWDADLLAEALCSLISDIPEEHPDLDVAAKLHTQMLSLFDALEKDELQVD